MPFFLPALYEHKAWFIDSTTSAIARDASLLTGALLAEYEAIGRTRWRWAWTSTISRPRPSTAR